jgi:predicted TPR repeat methyltransferase
LREQINQLVDQYASLSSLNPARATDTYVSSLFDGYAKTFESSLVGKLNYETPTIIANLLRSLISSVNLNYDILDLGCGTGLAGEALIDLEKTLVGIDLSKEMLKIAEAKNIYNRLIQDEIHQILISGTFTKKKIQIHSFACINSMFRENISTL